MIELDRVEVVKGTNVFVLPWSAIAQVIVRDPTLGFGWIFLVTDVGGPLSHSSIVAREYHIPAVLGTGVATERIKSDQQLTVDGDAGTVKMHNP